MKPETTVTPSWFSSNPSKAYYEKHSLLWAPTSMLLLLAGLLGTPLYKHCDRNTFLLITLILCLPTLYPLFNPPPCDLNTPPTQRFHFKASIWIAIFGFYGNYFWTHYFYQLLGAEYLFDSYHFNNVPLVTYIATYFYFTFYFSFINLLLRKFRHYTTHFPPPLQTLLYPTFIFLLSYLTALFEAISIQHFPLYTYTNRNLFLLIGSIVYALYFIIGFPMFFNLDEPPNPPSPLSHFILNSFAACAIVTLLLDLWRLFLGSIYNLGETTTINIPFIYQPNTTESETSPCHQAIRQCAATAIQSAIQSLQKLSNHTDL